MARKSYVQLQQQLPISFPDNINGLITPQILRDFFNMIFEALRPAYGYVSRDTPNVQSLGTSYTPLVCNIGFVSEIPDYTTTPSTGTVTRGEAGTTRMSFTASMEGALGRVVTVAVFKGGVETIWRTSATLQGAGKAIDVSLPAVEFTASGVAYQIQVKCDTASTSVTFDDVVFLAETVPVNTY